MRIRDSHSVLERESKRFRAQLVNEDDVPIGGAAVSTVTVLLYDESTGAIINGRDRQSIKNVLPSVMPVNDGMVDAAGMLTWWIQEDDNVILNTATFVERHVFLIEWTWTDANGPHQNKYEGEILVKNLRNVPA